MAPLRRHALPPLTDGCAAVVLAAGDRAYELCERPAFITGIDHRIETHSLGARDLTVSPSTKLAGEKAGVGDEEGRRGRAARALRATRSSSWPRPWGWADGRRPEPLGRRAGRQPDDVGRAHPHRRVGPGHLVGQADRAVAHATSGPCLQQNLVCVLEGV